MPGVGLRGHWRPPPRPKTRDCRVRKGKEQSMASLRLNIADLVLQVETTQPSVCLEPGLAYNDFIANGGSPSVYLHFHYGVVPDVRLGARISSGEGLWGLYEAGGKYVLQIEPGLRAGSGTPPAKGWITILEKDFSSGDMYLWGDDPITDSRPACIYPLAHPWSELLVVNLLSRGRGLEVHGCGVIAHGNGLLFCGVSGAGKSTLAELWKKRNVTILSDDRLILRQRSGIFHVYGTPWHGDARVSSNLSAPASRIYFLRKYPTNYLKRLPQQDAATQILTRCFPTFHLAEGMEFTLEFIDELTRRVPCYELGFVPEDSAIEMVLNHDGPEQ